MGKKENSQHVFIVGAKGIPAKYGGFETFVEMISKYNQDDFKLHVACMSDKSGEYEYNNAVCRQIKVPEIGSAKAVYYDCMALEYFISYCKMHPEISQPVFYVLACRIGFRIGHYRREIHKIGGKLYINPDGNEWKRKKWSIPVRCYWKFSERLMVKNADVLICDSINIEAYIKHEYTEYHPKTTFIPYGAEKICHIDQMREEKLKEWLEKKNLIAGNYYLMVGRFVPENNYETVIREFLKSDSKRKLAIVTGENHRLRDQISRKTMYQEDERICFVGTVYDQELLQMIRENAFAYIHGHEVGGTNPSLLEAMLCTNMNLLLNVVFNHEVGSDAALYWDKKEGNLGQLISFTESMSEEERTIMGEKARKRIQEHYDWRKIVDAYRDFFAADLEQRL